MCGGLPALTGWRVCEERGGSTEHPCVVCWELVLKGCFLGQRLGLVWPGGSQRRSLFLKALGKLRPGDCVELGSELKPEGWTPWGKIGMGQQGVEREWVETAVLGSLYVLGGSRESWLGWRSDAERARRRRSMAFSESL